MILDKILTGVEDVIGDAWVVSFSVVDGWGGDSSMGMG